MDTIARQIIKPDLSRETSVPLFASQVAAGFPSPADDWLEGELDLVGFLVRHPAATFYVRVSGDSMIGAGIHSNDILIVDRACKPVDGDVIIASINAELTVKRLAARKGRLQLVPENRNYKPIDITDEMNFEVWGKVLHVIHSF
ncbi:MAG TPA: translesion error-prone DNA polymerase V autoproteolytic subunit [Blastocatellia bacterium]|nr:translesion error-prone DNA polymerase V autoproteolytic subunit [Blastocatellia bacterium]